jgi:UTP--glucose-1-phosphate uridylyltransferase
MASLHVDAETLRTLAPYGFEPRALEALRERLSGPAASNAVTATLLPPAAGDVTPLPPLGSAARSTLRRAGLALIARGEVGVVVLAGGMATRFGGVVKAVVPVLEGKSFLALKAEDVERVSREAGGQVRPLVMSSFSTHDTILAHVREQGLLGGRLDTFPQFVSLRLTPGGALFLDDAGRPSPYATGHGDFSFALRRSGALARFRAAGGTLLMMSNVDNLGATVDPAMLALHRELGATLTAEVVRKEQGDKGGAPARLGGVPQIIEGFRFPSGFDQDTIPVFNTNTLLFEAAALDRDFALPFYRVEKQVDGRPAIQFERLVGELSAFLPTRFVEVPREGADGRFLPAKDPEELQRRLPSIAEVVRSTR